MALGDSFSGTGPFSLDSVRTGESNGCCGGPNAGVRREIEVHLGNLGSRHGACPMHLSRMTALSLVASVVLASATRAADAGSIMPFTGDFSGTFGFVGGSEYRASGSSPNSSVGLTRDDLDFTLSGTGQFRSMAGT